MKITAKDVSTVRKSLFDEADEIGIEEVLAIRKCPECKRSTAIQVKLKKPIGRFQFWIICVRCKRALGGI